jgi:hypothetical protein
MTTKEMIAGEHAQTARDFLTASDREFAAGDHLQGSEKLYGAATQVVIALCQQRGWRYQSHRAMKNAIADLAREFADPTIIGGFSAAERFHANFFHDNMEDYDMETERPAVHHFVDRMLALLDSEDANAE